MEGSFKNKSAHFPGSGSDAWKRVIVNFLNRTVEGLWSHTHLSGTAAVATATARTDRGCLAPSPYLSWGRLGKEPGNLHLHVRLDLPTRLTRNLSSFKHTGSGLDGSTAVFLQCSDPSFSTDIWHPKSHPQLWNLSHTLICADTKQIQKTIPPHPRGDQIQTSLLKAKVTVLAVSGRGLLPMKTPTWAVSPHFVFLEGQRPLLENNKMQCVWFTFLISLRTRKLSYTSVFLTPEPLFLHKYLIGQLSKCYFPEPPLAPLLESSGRLVGETLVRVLFFYFPSVLGGIHMMHHQNNGSIVFNSVFWLLRRKPSINVYVAVCSQVCRMRLSVSLTSRGAGGTHSFPLL